MKIRTMLGDISEIEGFDVIVNSTNNYLTPRSKIGNVDGAIHWKAGKGLDEECNAIGGCKTGEAVMTDAYALQCKKIIHTVGPVWQGDGTEEMLLESCYNHVLTLAKRGGFRKIAFPAIAVGSYRYPADEATRVAVDTVFQFCNNDPKAFDDIVFVLYSEDIKELYDKEIARKKVRVLGYLSLSLDIKSYDSRRLHQVIVELVEEKLSGWRETLKKMLLAWVDSIPEQTPEKFFVFITHHKQIKKILFASLNKYFEDGGYKFKIRDLMLQNRRGNGSLQLLLEIEEYNFTDVINNICQKIHAEREDNYTQLMISGVKIVNETIPEKKKEELLKNLINGLQAELGVFIERFLLEHYKLVVSIGRIELLN